MLRRNVPRTMMNKAKPMFEVLMFAQPGQPELWTPQMEVLNKNEVLNVASWVEMPDVTKNEIKRELTPTVYAMLDKVVQTQLGHEVKDQVLILYGSQTGTAESYAKMLGTMAVTHGFDPKVLTMNDAVALIRESATKPKAVIFVCSTYGTGEVPTNAQQFYKELQNNNMMELHGVPFAVFGLGNSKNPTFNVAAKNIDAKLRSMGGKSLMRIQLSCELAPNGHDAAFRTWKQGLWASLGGTKIQGGLGVSYKVTETIGAKADEHVLHPMFFDAVVHQNTIMTPKGYVPETRRIVFHVPMADQREQLGGKIHGRRALITDWVELFPYNTEVLVDRALKRLNFTALSIVEVAPLPGAAPSSIDFKKIRIRTLLSEIVDLSAVPTRSFLESLSLVATDATERAKLEDLANNLSSGSAYDELTSGIFTVVDALDMFPSVQLTMDQLLTHAPRIKSRTYSLATDNTKGIHEEFEVVYTIPHREQDDGKIHDGLCSGFIQALRAGHKLKVHFRPSGVEIPPDTEPLTILALGSGIGAARALLMHRQVVKANSVNVPTAKLIYGFRQTGKDQLFVEELNALEKAGIVQVTYVASHDVDGKFTPAMDKLASDHVKELLDKGHFYYCGLGGSVPSIVESALRRNGVDVSVLRASNRYHEEFFSIDVDAENLLKGHKGQEVKGDTLKKRMGSCEMFCFQCEQTFQGRGCNKVGVCGKTPRVAALQDLTVHMCKVLGYYLHHLRKAGAAEDVSANRLTLETLFSTLTNVNFDEERFVTYLCKLQSAVKAAMVRADGKGIKTLNTLMIKGDESANALVELGKTVGVLSRFTDPARQNIAGVSEMLAYGLKGVAAYSDHSLMNNREDSSIYAFMHEALSFLAQPDATELGDALKLCLRAGESNVTAMKQLYESNSSYGVPSPASVTMKPKPGKCILVSGHDLVILKGLLEVTEPLGINVYTHGEMLPAHGYPNLRKHKNLAGHYGGAWMRQSIEFPHFPGPILMTTNCLTEPHESYRDTIFTAGAVGWSGVRHIGNNMSDIKFDAVIDAAQSASGFNAATKEFDYTEPIGQTRPNELVVGFGHDAILSVAPTIIEQIQKGNITRFFLVGGCDGYEGQRSYYTELVKRLPKTCVVLTVGCGKYRINHLNLGNIGDTGIPRLLDLGQCNDSYSAIQVALSLAKVLNCQVSDLPLSIVLSWFEQKAIAVLLSCLHLGLKPIHVGPSLPAFLTPDVLSVLVNDFGIRVCADPEKDLQVMLAASGAS